MRIEFDEWITSQKISPESKDLFVEAVTCYKASAYRASLLFSYLGLQVILRDRMMSANRPTGIREKQWREMLRDAMDDDKWDRTVFDATQRKDAATVFALSDDMRNQIAYWKNRRNDCAHSKQNMISHSHVETFWLFVRSNLAKFVVNGSKEGLLSGLRTHFDYSLTPRGTDFSHLIEQLPSAVPHNELSDFFDQLYDVLHSSDTMVPVPPPPEKVSFWSAIAQIESEVINASLAKFLQSKNDRLLFELLRQHPQHVHLFTASPEFVRSLWYSRLFADAFSNDLPIYCSLLRNRLIPEDQIAEANARILSRLHDHEVSEEDYETLRAHGFFGALYTRAFQEGSVWVFEWANKKASMIALYVERFPVDDVSARAIHRTFDVPNHPFEAQKRLNRLFEENGDKRNEFLNKLVECELSIPRYLPALAPVEEQAMEISDAQALFGSASGS